MAFRINPENEGVWVSRGSIFKTAVETSDDRKFIPSFDLGTDFNSQFVAVGIKVNASRSNWKYGGYLTRDFSLDTSGYPINDTVFFRSHDLLINSVQVVEFPVLTANSYRLRFHPPNYFLDVTVQVWEYVGVVENECSTQTDSDRLDAIDLKLAQMQNTLARIEAAVITNVVTPGASISLTPQILFLIS